MLAPTALAQAKAAEEEEERTKKAEAEAEAALARQAEAAEKVAREVRVSGCAVPKIRKRERDRKRE